MSEAITFTAQLYDIKTRRDGGGRVQLEFGADAMHAIVKLMALNASGDTNLGIAIVPIGSNSNHDESEGYSERVDQETGELIID